MEADDQPGGSEQTHQSHDATVQDILAEADRLILLGEIEPARQTFAEARRLYREAGNVEGEATVLRSLGDLERAQGNHSAADRKSTRLNSSHT